MNTKLAVSPVINYEDRIMVPTLSPNGTTEFTGDAPPTQLFIGSANGVVVLKRDDPSKPWREEGTSLKGKHIGALINVAGVGLFAGCHHRGGLWRSVDGGREWESIGKNIVASDIFSLANFSNDQGPVLLAGVEPVNLYCSHDRGDSWEEYPSISVQPGGELWSFPPPPHLPHLKSIAIDPFHANTFFGCVEQGALLKTSDAGRSWQELSTMWSTNDRAYRDAHRLIVAPWDPQLLIFASGVGVYRSNNGGASWERADLLEQFITYPDVLVGSVKDRALYVGGPADVPGDWPGGSPTGALCKSLDGGSTWKVLQTGLSQGNFEALTIVNHSNGYELFAGDTSGRVYTSNNAGESWQCIASTAAISKGAHHKLADMSIKLPRWVGSAITALFYQVTRVTMKRAAARRRVEFSNRVNNSHR